VRGRDRLVVPDVRHSLTVLAAINFRQLRASLRVTSDLFGVKAAFSFYLIAARGLCVTSWAYVSG
jgi:hypothetical protein